MDITSHCPYCRALITVTDDALGTMMICPGCGKEARIYAPKHLSGSAKTATATGIDQKLITFSYIMCFILPIVGLFMGVYLAINKKMQEGVLCIVISIITSLLAGAIVWALLTYE